MANRLAGLKAEIMAEIRAAVAFGKITEDIRCSKWWQFSRI